jgi:predicted nucleotidyltransferase
LLVDLAPGARPTLFSLARLDRTPECALGVRVDVVARANLNPRLATHIEKDLVAG